MPAQVTEGCDAVVTDEVPHCLLLVLRLGQNLPVCYSEPVGIRHAWLDGYLTVEEYRPEVKSARCSVYGEVELRGKEDWVGVICSAPVSSRTLKAYCNVSGSAGDGNGVLSARVAASGTGEVLFLCDHGLS
jgi:hypothetical protein